MRKRRERRNAKDLYPRTREKAQQLISYYISKWEQSNHPVVIKDADLEDLVKAIYRRAANTKTTEREAVWDYLTEFYTDTPEDDDWFIED